MSGEILRGADARDHALVADAVVIGSGAGGAVAAHALAERGRSVVILEAGAHHTSADFTQREDEMLPLLFEGRGSRRTADELVNVLQARTVGGSTVVNMADCTPIPASVLERWRRDFAVDLDEEALADPYARVRRMLGVRPIERREVNANNARLLEGARRLGWSAGVFEHNRTGCTGSGYCLLGCAYDAKRSALVTYVPAAVGLGATLVSDAEVERIVVERGAARGVVARWGSGERGGAGRRRLEVRAAHVVLAAGAVGTPVLLERSGIAAGTGLVGANLSLQPQAPVMATFDEEVRAFRGIPQSSFVDEFEVFDPAIGMGGFRVEGIASGPAMTAGMIGGFGAAHLALMRRFAHTSSALVLVPDQPAGRVRVDRGRPVLEYALSADVARRLRRGARAAAEAYFAAGASEVMTPLGGGVRLTDVGQLDRLQNAGVAPGLASLISAHPQGTARMGEDPRRAVVDSRGRCHSVAALTICDASVFPTSASSHTMIPIMAFADLAARTI